MIKELLLSIAVAATTSFGAWAGGQKECVVECHVSGRPDSKILLYLEAGKDFRISGFKGDSIRNGKATFTVPADTVKAFQVMFDDEVNHGSWRIRNFFAEGDTVKLFYHGPGEEANDSIVSGSINNRHLMTVNRLMNEKYQPQLNPIYEALDPMYENGAVYRDDVRELVEKMNKAGAGAERDSLRNLFFAKRKELGNEVYSAEYHRLNGRIEDLLRAFYNDQLQYIEANPSVYGLMVLKDNLAYDSDLRDMGKQIEVFEQTYSNNPSLKNHPYVADILSLIDGSKIKPGEVYPAISFRDKNGELHDVRALIAGKPAVINLWASWCGPCRGHSKELIPIYEKYKADGFKVIAIARESKDTSDMELAMKTDGYPWESFVDLNDADSIWKRHGTAFSGGRIILVDQRGIIRAVDPSAAEIEAFLKNEYKH